MENLDLIILTIIVTLLYVGFAWGLFAAQKKQQRWPGREPPVLCSRDAHQQIQKILPNIKCTLSRFVPTQYFAYFFEVAHIYENNGVCMYGKIPILGKGQHGTKGSL